MSTQAVAARSEQAVVTLKELVEKPVFANRIKEILKERSPQFVASLMQIWNSTPALKKCEPTTVLASAITAAALDLPIDKSLGFAHIVPYGTEAQFQMGYKGFIQLALRTSQYKKMNAACINEEAYKGRDEVGDPVIDWEKWDDTKPAVGYAFAWQTVTGFTKLIYWPKKKVEEHALRYSQAYKKGYQTPWKTDFDKMALKTVVKDGLSHWGIMSVELRRAMVADQGIQRDLEGNVEYPDNHPGMTASKPKFDTEVTTDAPRSDDDDGDLGPQTKPSEKTVEVEATVKETKPEPAKEPAKQPAKEPAKAPEKQVVQTELADPGAGSPQIVNDIKSELSKRNIEESKFCAWIAAKHHLSPADTFVELVEAAPSKTLRIWKQRNEAFEEYAKSVKS